MARRWGADVSSASTLYRLLQACIRKKDLDGGRQVHALIATNGLQSNPFLGNHLIRFYAMFGKLVEAKDVFVQLPRPDKFVWAAIISAHTDHGRPEQAIKLYEQMRKSRCGEPDDHVLVAALKACANAAALPAGYAQYGDSEGAFTLFNRMQEQGWHPDKMTITSMLKACSGAAATEQGQLLHSQIKGLGLESDVFVGSSLVDMHAKCGNLEDARLVFDGLEAKDLVTWTAMIAAYAQHGDGHAAIDLLHTMRAEGVQPNQRTLACILKACASVAALDQGKLLHHQIMACGYDSNIYIGSSLIDMYAKCGSLKEAQDVFDGMPTKNLVTWTAMISGYVLNGCGHDALDLFHRMQLEGTSPNQLTLVSTLKACSAVGSLDHGRLLHAQIVQSGLEFDSIVGSTLIDMYARCGSLENAHSVFDSFPSRRSTMLWSALIAGYAHQERGLEALQLFHAMQLEGVEADKAMFFSVLKACSTVAAFDQGKLLHAEVRSAGLEADLFMGNILVDFYVKCGNPHEAQALFDRLPNKDFVTWTALIAGYAHHGDNEEVLNLFEQMQHNGMQPNKVTLVNLLKVCSAIPALQQGRLLHARIIQEAFESDVFVSNALVDMYAKCGTLEDARGVFNRMPAKDLVSWNAMIYGCSMHGFAQEALDLFERMQAEGVHPDSVTFIELLSACSHSGLLDESSTLFESMSRDFGITPELEHYVCMVDVLGRSGRLHEGYDFICQMPVEPDVIVWMPLLGACRIRKNLALGEQIFEAIVALDPSNTAAHVLIGEIYLEAGMWERKAEIRKRMQGLGFLRKEPGRTWIEFASELHPFGVDDKVHPDRKRISATLSMLTREIGKGCEPELDPPAVQAGNEDGEDDPMCDNVERLALTFSLLSLPLKHAYCLN